MRFRIQIFKSILLFFPTEKTSHCNTELILTSEIRENLLFTEIHRKFPLYHEPHDNFWCNKQIYHGKLMYISKLTDIIETEVDKSKWLIRSYQLPPNIIIPEKYQLYNPNDIIVSYWEIWIDELRAYHTNNTKPALWSVSFKDAPLEIQEAMKNIILLGSIYFHFYLTFIAPFKDKTPLNEQFSIMTKQLQELERGIEVWHEYLQKKVLIIIVFGLFTNDMMIGTIYFI